MNASQPTASRDNGDLIVTPEIDAAEAAHEAAREAEYLEAKAKFDEFMSDFVEGKYKILGETHGKTMEWEKKYKRAEFYWNEAYEEAHNGRYIWDEESEDFVERNLSPELKAKYLELEKKERSLDIIRLKAAYEMHSMGVVWAASRLKREMERSSAA